MEHQEQLEKETEEAINAINKKTGRNMPQAIATGAVLVILILACLLISIDLFVYLVVLFMVLALWELRVDFATAGLHIPVPQVGAQGNLLCLGRGLGKGVFHLMVGGGQRRAEHHKADANAR